jgi:hypothetical protein
MSAPQILAAARAADPQQAPWGCYLVPAEEGGDGLLWFATEAALIAFVRDGLWSALHGVLPAPGDQLQLNALLEGPSPLRWDTLDGLNQVLEPVAQLHWWGSLQQLYEGQDPFAKDLREAWRDSAGRGPQDFSALRPEELRAFCDFLKLAFSE